MPGVMPFTHASLGQGCYINCIPRPNCGPVHKQSPWNLFVTPWDSKVCALANWGEAVENNISDSNIS